LIHLSGLYQQISHKQSAMARQYRVGEAVPYHYNSLIVVASCFNALLGSITAVEILHRKRATRQNWIHWFGIPFSAIWR
jgi:hypothetical protein